MKKNILVTLLIVLLGACHFTNNHEKNSNTMAIITDTAKHSKEINYSSGFAPVNGLNMYYEIHGDGAPLVLIHGGGSTIQTSFGSILPLLAEHYKVIAVELQAHGHTKDRDTPESFVQDADDVAALLAYLKTDSAFFLGFSNGGQTLIEMGMRHPAIIRKLVIVSAFYTREGAVKGFFDGMMQHAGIDNMPEPLRTTYLNIPGNNQQGLLAMFERDKTRMINFKSWSDKDLLSIKAPTLVIAGNKDVVTPAHAVEMSQKMPDASVVILPGTHGSFIGELCTGEPGSKMPAMTVALIEEFLDK